MNFDPKGIGELLAGERLIVPLNQRDYSWEDDHVEDLINDFSAAMNSDTGIHFVGSIVLTGGDTEYPEITDGQQRLATTTMMLAAFRDYFIALGRDEDADSIDRDFLFKWDRSQGENVSRLTLNSADHVFFETNILSRPSERPKRNKDKKLPDSHQMIQDAFDAIRKYFSARLEPETRDNKVRIINEWLKFIEKSALVVAITVPADLDAYTMFETLNDRGLDTSKADLLKNHLFSKCKDRMREAQQKWAGMMGKLETLGHKKITVTYIRHLLITKYGPTKEREVLKTIKDQIKKPSQAVSFLDLMVSSADDYAAMLNPSHKKWNAHGDDTRDHLWTIHLDLEIKQIWPLLFAVTSHFNVAQAKLAFKYLVNLSVRFLIVGGRGGLLDRHYSLRAQDVGTGKIKTAKELAKALGEIAPTDEAFEVQFRSARVSDANLARYYLRALENKRDKLPSPEVMPIEDRKKMTLEHILPENPEDKWPDFSADDADAYYRRIGNLVLMLGSQNAFIGNGDFEVKRPVLKASGLSLTNMAGKQAKWTKKAIEDRQRELAKLAVETWPLTIE